MEMSPSTLVMSVELPESETPMPKSVPFPPVPVIEMLAAFEPVPVDSMRLMLLISTPPFRFPFPFPFPVMTMSPETLVMTVVDPEMETP